MRRPVLDEPDGASSKIPSDSILELTSCPVCGCEEFTPVCEYHKFLVIDSNLVDGAAAYYDSMCLLALARRMETRRPCVRMPARERDRRIQAYHAARDLAILKLPAHLTARFAGAQQDVVRRAVDSEPGQS
jgi:hypothetical protein